MEAQGAFREWTEDAEGVELRLPVPEGASKRSLNCKATPTALRVTHDGQNLLLCDPLATRIVSDETTWYLEEGVMIITLAKMQGVGRSDAEQMCGPSLGKPGGRFECYLAPDEVARRLGISRPTPRPSRRMVTLVMALVVAVAAAAVAAAYWK